MNALLRKHFRWLFFLSLFIAGLAVSLNVVRTFSYQDEIWADRAGYYVYLPATFMYHFDYNKFPPNIDERTGWGFSLDPRSKTVQTKYSCGVAILVSPFFLAARLVATGFHFNEVGGFSRLFHRMVDVSAVFYLVFGLFLLHRVLSRYFRCSVSYLVVILVFAGTNLFYYGLEDPLMSHVYSFFLCSLFLFAVHKYFESGKFRYFLLLGFTGALGTLIRPTNIVVLALLFLWNVDSFSSFVSRVRETMSLRNVSALIVISTLVFLPQVMYWKYAYGHYLEYTYTGETFSNWSRPKLPEVWFSTLNGLFLYSPLYLVVVAGMGYMIFSRIRNGLLVAFVFLLVSYLCGSWWCWYFACSYGQRSFIDFLPLFAIPLGYLVSRVADTWKEIPRAVFMIAVFAMAWYNIRMSVSFNHCFYGSVWDWNEFGRQAEKAGLYKPGEKNLTFQNDFENIALNEGCVLNDSVAWSGSHSGQLDRRHEFCGTFWRYAVKDLGPGPPWTVDIGLRVLSASAAPTGASVVCNIENGSRILTFQSSPLDLMEQAPGRWYRVRKRFMLPVMSDTLDKVVIYVWNPGRKLFWVDDLKIGFH
jgi:hypothetical protein